MAEDNIYILSDIVKRLGDATADEVRVEFEGLANDDFIAKGRRIGTPRLVKELARNYGRMVDWLPSANGHQKELLGFVGMDWLRMAAWSARQAETRHDALATGASQAAATKQVRSSKAEELLLQAKHVRERFYTSLRNVAGGLAVWNSRIDAAYAAPETATPVSDSLVALCDVAEKMLTEATAGMTNRLARNQVTPDKIKRHRDVAAAAASAVREADAVAPATTVSQADVDLWDGIAMTFFEQFVDAVEDARKEDPTIPAPSIIGLRNWFRRSTRKAPAAEAPGEAPVE